MCVTSVSYTFSIHATAHITIEELSIVEIETSNLVVNKVYRDSVNLTYIKHADKCDNEAKE